MADSKTLINNITGGSTTLFADSSFKDTQINVRLSNNDLNALNPARYREIQNNALKKYDGNDIDVYANLATEAPLISDNRKANTEDKKTVKPEDVGEDDSLIPPLNYTDPKVKHDPNLFIPPIVMPYIPNKAKDINDKGEIGTFEQFDYTKVTGILHPVIEVGNRVLSKEHIITFKLSYRSFAPSLSLTIRDIDGFGKRADLFGMNSEIKVVILPPLDNTYRPIRLLFQITSADFYEGEIRIRAEYKLPSIKTSVIQDITFPECKKCKHPASNKTSTWEMLHTIALRTGLGFASTKMCEEIHDRNPRFLSGENYLDFMQKEIPKGGLDENSLFDAWIDLYNYIVMVNVPYVFTSDITYRHLSIRAITGLHSTVANVNTKQIEHLQTVHRVLTNHNLTSQPSNLEISDIDVEISNNAVEIGNLSHEISYTPRGVGGDWQYPENPKTPDDEDKVYDTRKLEQQDKKKSGPVKKGNNTIETQDILTAQNSFDGSHLKDYTQSRYTNIRILRDDTNTKLQQALRAAFFRKHRQRVYRVRLSKMNLDIQRGTIVELRWYESDPVAKQQAAHSIGNVTGEQSIEKNPVGWDSNFSDRRAVLDAGHMVLNLGNSGQFYVDGMEFEYNNFQANDNNQEIIQHLFLIKRGITDNLANKYTSPRIDEDAFSPKAPYVTPPPDGEVVLQTDVGFQPVY